MNKRHYTSLLKVSKLIAFCFGWTTVTHPPYSSDLAPPDYHLFGPLNEEIRARHFTRDQEVKHAVRNWLKMQRADFYKASMVFLVHPWTVEFEKRGDYIEK